MSKLYYSKISLWHWVLVKWLWGRLMSRMSWVWNTAIQHRILDGIYVTLICCKIVLILEKTEINEKRVSHLKIMQETFQREKIKHSFLLTPLCSRLGTSLLAQILWKKCHGLIFENKISCPLHWLNCALTWTAKTPNFGKFCYKN